MGESDQFATYEEFDVDGRPKQEEEPPKGLSCWNKMCPVLTVLIVFGILGAAGYFISQAVGGDSLSSSNGPGSDKTNKKGDKTPVVRPSTCPTILPSKRLVVFWQTEQKGCSKVPDGVTHVIFGFSEVKEGTSVTSLKFQGHTATLKDCIAELRKRCIYSLGSVGGANNVKAMSTITKPVVFADSVYKLLKEYDFDGIDIDDEAVGAEFNAKIVVNYVRAVKEKLKTEGVKDKKTYILTFDGLIYDGVKSVCTDPIKKEYSRCFPQEIVQYLDWVHIMAYNVAKEPALANKLYMAATNTTFPEWMKTIFKGNGNKLTIGTCIKTGCAYGPGPSAAVVKDWAAYAKKAGGLMLYSASADYTDSFKETKNLISLLK